MIRGALVGVGNAALLGHLPAYLEDPWLRSHVQIVAAADRCAPNLGSLRGRVAGIRTYEGLDDLLERGEEIDFVDICAPPNVRLDVIREASRRGWHILCEKPLATRWAEGLEIQRALEDHPVVFMPCHQYRYSPLWRAVARILADGVLGEVRLAQFEVLRTGADPGSPNWRAGWRRRREIAGGGVLFDIGTHYFYLVISLFGMPVAVTARTARLLSPEDDVEDTAFVILDYPRRQRLVEVNLSWAAAKRENRFRIIGSAGSLESDGDTLRLTRGTTTETRSFEGAMAKAAYPKWYAELFREFSKAVLDGAPSPEPLSEAVNALRCAESAYASAESGRLIVLGEPAA